MPAAEHYHVLVIGGGEAGKLHRPRWEAPLRSGFCALSIAGARNLCT